MKLSKTQLAILGRLDSGDELTLMKGLNAWYMWRGTYSPSPRSDSIHRLRTEGMIEEKPGGDWRAVDDTISDKGRAYLDGLPGGRCVK